MKQQATLLLPCLLTGGTEVATLDTAKALKELGYPVRVTVYFDEIDPDMLATFRQEGIDVQLLGLPRRSGFVGTAALAKALTNSLWRQSPSLVWVQYMTPTLIPLLVSRFFTRRLVAAVHVAARHYSPGGLRRLRWLASWWCNKLVCVSQTTARGVLGERPDSRLEQKVRVIPNALDMQSVNTVAARDWRAQLRIAGDHRIIGYVGRLAHNKGVDVLLKAAAFVDMQFPDTHWIVVGDGAEMQSLQQLATDVGMAEKVHFVGIVPRDAVFSALKGFDIAVVPSREEGFGLTALEAMACGVPLVASRVDALQETILENKTGLLFDSENHQMLADKLVKLLKNDSLRNRLRQAGAKRVDALYSASIYRTRLHELTLTISQ